ncbi:MAG TPA: glycosyltransferase family 2 protein [Phycisphaerae bacterium]|nr:glycosyltransferase family 2 protein [Phycisphaerae bacterium]
MFDRDQLEAVREGRHVPQDLASIIIPHYQTGDLARLCLRAIRRLTDHPFEVIVVDNHSQDGSLEVLRAIKWIRLVERGPETEDHAVYAHAGAMDVGTAAARGRWLVSFHTDTIVRRAGWLGEMLARLKANPKAAALGSDKLDTDPGWYRAMKRLWDTHRMKALARRLAGLAPDARHGPSPWYPRSYCAVYRLDLVRELGLDWQPAPGRPTGERLYRGLVDAGYEGIRLTAGEMHEYVEHVAHATALLGRGGVGHWRGNQKVRGALRRIMGSDLARELLSDDSLDR